MALAAEKVQRQAQYELAGSKFELTEAKNAAAAAKEVVVNAMVFPWERSWDDLVRGKKAPFASKEQLCEAVKEVLMSCPLDENPDFYMSDFELDVYDREGRAYVVNGSVLYKAFLSASYAVRKQEAVKIRREVNAKLGLAKNEVVIRKRTLVEAADQNNLSKLADRTIIGKIQKADVLLKQERTAFSALATYSERM
jgi:hypothetical protein